MDQQSNAYSYQNGYNSAVGNSRLEQDWIDGGQTISLSGYQGEVIRSAHSALMPQENVPSILHQENNQLYSQSSNRRIDEGIVNDSQQFGTPFENQVVDVDPMTSYQSRLNTYANWPCEVQVSPNSLARAGLVYLGEDDRTQCDFCRGILYSWDNEDDPLVEHQKHFENCPFLQGRSWERLDRLLHEQRLLNERILHQQRLLNEERQRLAYEESQNLSHQQYVFSEHSSSILNSGNRQSNHRLLETSIPHDSKLAAAMTIVKQMGYSDKLIEKAIHNILQHSNIVKDTINSALLLDNLFELEENESLPEIDNVESQQEQFQNVASLCIKQSEPSFACAQFSAVNNGNSETICRAACSATNNSISQNMDPLTVEREQLKKNVLCNLCFSKKIGMLFLPCRHMIACEDCGTIIKECLKCSKKVVATVRIYMA